MTPQSICEGPGRHLSDRDLSSALLHHDGGVEPRTWGSADPPARGRSSVGDAGGPRGAVLGGGHQANWAGPHAGSAGRTLRRRHRPALGGLERRPRRTTLGRHLAGGPERARQLYVVVPEPDPALRRQGSAHGGGPGAIRIRRDLRRIFGPGADRRKRQAGGRSVDRALHRANQRDIVGFASGWSISSVSSLR